MQGQSSENLPPALGLKHHAGRLSQELVMDGPAVDCEDSGFPGFRSHTTLLLLFPALAPKHPPLHQTHISLGRTPLKQMGEGVPEEGSSSLLLN